LHFRYLLFSQIIRKLFSHHFSEQSPLSVPRKVIGLLYSIRQELQLKQCFLFSSGEHF
jgi:hypothetical protein